MTESCLDISLAWFLFCYALKQKVSRSSMDIIKHLTVPLLINYWLNVLSSSFTVNNIKIKTKLKLPSARIRQGYFKITKICKVQDLEQKRFSFTTDRLFRPPSDVLLSELYCISFNKCCKYSHRFNMNFSRIRLAGVLTNYHAYRKKMIATFKFHS